MSKKSKLIVSRTRNDVVIPAAPESLPAVLSEDTEDNPHPLPRLIDPPRLLSKKEVVRLVGRSYDSLWRAMIRGAFPRGRYFGQKLFWFSTTIEDFLASLPEQRLKGDAPREPRGQRLSRNLARCRMPAGIPKKLTR